MADSLKVSCIDHYRITNSPPVINMLINKDLLFKYKIRLSLHATKCAFIAESGLQPADFNATWR